MVLIWSWCFKTSLQLLNNNKVYRPIIIVRMYISPYFFKVDEHDSDICVSLGAMKLTKSYFSAVWPDVGRM